MQINDSFVELTAYYYVKQNEFTYIIQSGIWTHEKAQIKYFVIKRTDNEDLCFSNLKPLKL